MMRKQLIVFLYDYFAREGTQILHLNVQNGVVCRVDTMSFSGLRRAVDALSFFRDESQHVARVRTDPHGVSKDI